MNYCYRLVLNLAVIVAIGCFFPIFPAYSSSNFNQFKADNFLQLGIKDIQFNNYIKAVKNFTQAIDLNNNFPAAYSNRCLAHLQLTEYHNAVADCTAALNFLPDNTEA